MAEREYYVRLDDDECGWCVFKKNDALISTFIAGPFDSMKEAKSECFKLNSAYKGFIAEGVEER